MDALTALLQSCGLVQGQEGRTQSCRRSFSDTVKVRVSGLFHDVMTLVSPSCQHLQMCPFTCGRMGGPHLRKDVCWCRQISVQERLTGTTAWISHPAAKAARTLLACGRGLGSAAVAANPWMLHATSSAAPPSMRT